MATSAYMTGRKRNGRPQAILWSENPGTLSNGLYVPNGYEVGGAVPQGTSPDLIDQFIVLSDHNRSDISFNINRIEQRERTINGRMRSFHISDKKTISFSWDNLPSRGYYARPNYNESTGLSPYKGINSLEHTVDGGAGGVDILNWYENHSGPFWMYLAYDRYDNFANTSGQVVNSSYANLQKYNEVIQVYFSDFNYSVQKRGQSNFDLWNISVNLEEV